MSALDRTYEAEIAATWLLLFLALAPVGVYALGRWIRRGWVGRLVTAGFLLSLAFVMLDVWRLRTDPAWLEPVTPAGASHLAVLLVRLHALAWTAAWGVCLWRGWLVPPDAGEGGRWRPCGRR